jgi:hypothetical protein
LVQYTSLGGTTSWLGFPRSDQYTSNGRPRSDFEGGYITTQDGINYEAFPYNPCNSYSISPSSQSFPSGGGSGAVNVTANTGCAWTATSNAPWISITSGSSGSGGGTVRYSVSSNPGQQHRTGAITIAGRTFTVTQNGTSPPPPPACGGAAAIAFGQTVSGVLQNGDCLRNGRFYDAYTFNGTAGQRIYIALNSAQFDTYLYLYRGNYPGGALWNSNDDGGGGRNSRIPAVSGSVRLPSTGIYTILASSYSSGETGSYTMSLGSVLIAAQTRPGAVYDFDSDGKTDYGVFRPSDGTWYIQSSTNGYEAAQFGVSTDKLAPADYDGDGRTDIAVFRDGNWHLLRSTDGFTSVQFGAPGDVPQPADFSGDGKAELAVFRPSNGTWYWLNLQNNEFSGVQFGISIDKPVAADYDGDLKADPAVYRNGIWYLLRSSAGFIGIQFGLATDKAVPADFDGDLKTDLAVYRQGNWYILQSVNGQLRAQQFGVAEDKPSVGDYDGDDKADIAVWRPSNGTFYVLQSEAGFTGLQFGTNGDKPVASALAP